MDDAACKSARALIDTHFDGRGRPAQEQTLREHLRACPACREYYARHQVLSGLDPKASSTEERMAAGLGLATARPRRVLPVLGIAGASAAALLVFLLVLLPGEHTPRPVEEPDAGFASRGASQPMLAVYRVRPGRPPEAVREEIAPDEELAFAYLNPGGKKHLLVFGVDDTEKVYWYHPAWQDADLNPSAVPIEPGERLRELPEGISHVLAGRRLTIHAIFTDRPISVREVEAWLKEGEPARTPLADDAPWLRREIRIRREP